MVFYLYPKFDKLIIYACKNGHFEMVQHLLQINPNIFSTVSKYMLFGKICYNGHLELAQWFIQKNPNFDFYKNIQDILEKVCLKGHLDVIQWLIQEIKKITPSHWIVQWLAQWWFQLSFVKIDYDELFIKACCGGHLHVAKWLFQTESNINVSKKNEGPFRFACCYNHLHIAQWLFQTKPNINVSVDNEVVFVCACANGNLDVAKWLLQIKPTIDIFIHNDQSFRSACCNGFLEVANWLASLCPEKYKIISSVPVIPINSIERKYFVYQINYKIVNSLNIVGTKYILPKDVSECYICQNEKCNIITCCNHSFCKQCINDWFEREHFTCPICRNDLNNTKFKALLVENM